MLTEPQTKAQKHNSIDLLRLSGSELNAIQRRLKVMGPEGRGESYRDSARHSYRKNRILVQLQGMHDLSATTYLMKPYDISHTGISLLHGTFVYPDTPCLITLLTLDGETVQVRGTVVRCRLVSGRVHELGVRFSESMNVDCFVNSNSTAN